MLNTEQFIDLLLNEVKIKEFTGVPCSNLRYLINYTTSKEVYLESPNEGEAVAYSVGRYLGNMDRVCILMQNSGLTNAMNAISSLSYINKIPQLYIIGFRGRDNNDEPQHKLVGKMTERWLTNCEILFLHAKDFSSEKSLVDNIIMMLDHNISVAVLVDKDDFTFYEPYSIRQDIVDKLCRDSVLDTISTYRDKDTIVVTTTGYTSRAMYDRYRNPNNFYMVGSMGDALAIGCGLAKSRPDKKIIVVDGDGAIMMRPQVAIMASILDLNNLCHIVIENGKYETTGNQYCPGIMSYDIEEMLSGLYGEDANIRRRFIDLEVLKYYLENFISGNKISPYIIMSTDTNLNDNRLGRPKETTEELKLEFMKSIGSIKE